MENAKILRYDGSFNGFLSVIYRTFETKMRVMDIQINKKVQKGLFTETETIITDRDKARRVWNGIQIKNNAAIKTIYFSFLSETNGIELPLYKYIYSLYHDLSEGELEELQSIKIKLHHYAGMVAREKHRIEAIAKFRISQDDIYFSALAPHCDVLPLISKYYRSKFPHNEFLIYDLKRRYAIYYDLGKTEIITRDLSPIHTKETLSRTNLKPLVNNFLYSNNTIPEPTTFRGEKTAV
ncbi:hypothetical protein KCTC52924_03836 [Arenibacter antarcticus]|uniref:TIGR03915 family putative DNA repair protein n=1 Tax=Arenibacter antarcticus TaxID=2040469 RepID=A0ABW5VFL2_9FLAO|nr:TIGR03915 family putative DNA repair protein [Arenibacter sp. H213]MCM4168273.1 DNA metabolism protein [Arenibacter sp. H213]